jgi:hypothetical protein
MMFMVVHTCNPSYPVGRVRRTMSLRPPWAKVAMRPCLKNRRAGA